MKKFFSLNACRVETTKIIINTYVTKELKLFVSKSLFKINNKINSSTTQVTFPLLLMLTLGKKLSFMQHLYFGSNNEVIKTENKISIMTLIKGHWNCLINWSKIINSYFLVQMLNLPDICLEYAILRLTY